MATEDISKLQIKVSSDGITETKNKLDKLTESADKAEQVVKKLGTQVITSNNGMAASSGVTVALTNALLTLNSTLSGVTVRTVASSDAIRTHASTMRDAHDAARGLAGSLGVLWTTYGNLLPLAAGLATGVAIKGIISSGSAVEHAIESLRVKGGETVETANQLREAILSVGKGAYGPKEVASALDALVLAGLSGKEAVDALKASLNLATAGGGSDEKAAESLVTIGTAVGATARQYDYLADGITKAANTSLASVDSISEAVKRGSVVNKLYGASFEDILTQAAALSQLGIKNSAAGTAITNFYADSIGKTEKAKKALQELGFSFYDTAGKAKPLVEALEGFNDKLNQFTEKKQGRLVQDIFGERGLRDVVGLLDLVRTGSETAKNKLEEVSQAINNAAGTAAIAAAQLSLTTENQFKSVKNTLESAFVGIFKDLEPQLNVVSARLKAAFGSPEFASAVGNIATAVGNLTVMLAENAGAVQAVVEGILAYKLITTGGAIFSSLIPVVNGLAATFGAVTVAANGAAVATGAFGVAVRLLPGVGIVLGVISAAMALVAINSTKMKDSAQQTADAYNTNFLQALTDEADRLDKVNDLTSKGVELRQAELKATRELALEKVRLNNQSAIESAQKKYDKAITDGKNAPYQSKLGFKNEAEKALKELDAAKKRAEDTEADIALQISRIEVASATQRAAYKQQQAEQASKLHEAAGTNAGNEIDKEQQKRIDFYASERLELEHLIATYKARTEAVLQGAAAEHRVLATVAQDRVKVNGPAKYPSMAAYNDELALAARADKAKFDQQNANGITEQENKITEILNREAAYQQIVNVGAKEHTGLLEKQTIAVLNFNNASKAEIAIQAERAKKADEILRIEDARKKLETATGSANARAQGYIEEAEAIAKYGATARQTAVEAANLQIAKLKLDGTGSEGLIKSRLEAAAMEDLGRSYVELAKQAADLDKEEEIRRAAGLEGVIGAETAKVVAYQETTLKALEFDKQRAASALEVAQANGDAEGIGKAKKAFDDVVKLSDKVKKQLDKNFAINLKVAGLKDVANIFSRMAHDANALGESFAHVGTALDGLSSGFSKLAEINAKQGIDEKQRNEERIGAYGDLAQASAGFFQENSKGYNTLMGISKIFHALELAQSAIRIGKLAIEAVLNQSRGDPYTAFGRMAAMAAIVATLGYAVGGGFNHNSSTGSSDEVQHSQGTGTVFGDATAKSDSIAKSLEGLKDNSNVLLPLTQGIYNSLLSIRDNISGLTNLVIRTTGIKDGSNLGIQTGTISSGPTGFIGSLAISIDNILSKVPVFSGVLAGLANKLGSLWGSTKKEIIDSGLLFGGSLGALQGGQGFNQYANVQTTKSSWFGLSKNTSSSVVTQGLDAEISKQFGLIFTNLEDSLKLAGSALGKSAYEVGSALDKVVIETTKVSLKGLSGKDLQDAISGVISKTLDQIAKAAFPEFGDFQKVGEGYAETVLRVAGGVDKANSVLQQLGLQAVNYKDIINKQGDVATEIVKQSIAAAEGLSGVNTILQNMSGSVDDLASAYKELTAIRSAFNGVGLDGKNLNQNVIIGAGGIAPLKDALSSYQDAYFTDQEKAAIMLKSVTSEFNKLGLALPANKAALRDLIEKTGVSTEANSKLTGQLLVLAGAYDELTQAADKARQEQIDGLNETISSLKDFANSLKSFREGLLLGDLSTLTPEEKYAEAKAQYEDTLKKAMAGDKDAQAKLTDAAQAFLDASRVINASGDGYSKTFDQVQKDLEGLEKLTEGKITDAEKQLELLEKQADSLKDLNKTAEGIRADLAASSLRAPNNAITVDSSDMQKEIAQLRQQLAEAQAKNAQQMNDLIGAMYNSQAQGADKVADAVVTAARDTAWVVQTTNTVTKER